MDKRYLDRVALLVRILPLLQAEPRFALKGGTAINLFEHGLPRLSVDIDLTWLPTRDFETDSVDIGNALEGIADRLRAPPFRLQVQPSASAGARTIHRLIVREHSTQVQVETSPVMRGTVHPVRQLELHPDVERRFGSARAQVLDFLDLYAGKLCAALSRQHPRDLFDVGLLMDAGRFDIALWHTFLVYLTASPKPAAEMLAPADPREFTEIFENHFKGMTVAPVAEKTLLDHRTRLLTGIGRMIDDASIALLESVEEERPDFGLIGLPQAANLPGVRRKLQNLSQRTPDKRAADRARLTEVLDRLHGQSR
ncbi:MAG: nucleotidyl transferase AbiEii/AbiGii toxin family protein [Rhizobium sp.]|nr:nucleotidyl transferase AbiEii/AbiGii toxin family protein [Rhizobium sp.]